MVIDRVRFGRRLRAVRDIAGIESTLELAERLIRRYPDCPHSVERLARLLESWERGETHAPLDVDVFYAIVNELEPDGGFHFFRRALRADVAANIGRLETEGE